MNTKQLVAEDEDFPSLVYELSETGVYRGAAVFSGTEEEEGGGRGGGGVSRDKLQPTKQPRRREPAH